MSAWPQEELRRMRESDDLHIAPFRQDGKTYGTPTWIWSVVVNDDLYARAYNGTGSSWYQAAVKQQAGRIMIAGITKKVRFESVADEVNDAIDEAYESKYKASPYLAHMIGNRARSATVRILP